MKAFFQVIAEFFQNMDGSGSSRRLVGIGLTVCGIVGIFLGKDAMACLGLVTGGVGLLALTTADNHTVSVTSTIDPKIVERLLGRKPDEVAINKPPALPDNNA